MTIITFNVGGKRYQVNDGTILNNRNIKDIELLPMLVKQHIQNVSHPHLADNTATNNNTTNNTNEIFIDRDHKLFRWILYIYRYDIIPTYNMVGISENMWNNELDYFGLNEEPHIVIDQENNVPKDRLINESSDPQEQRLINLYNKRIIKLEAEKKEEMKRKDDEFNINKPRYLRLLTEMLERGSLCFIDAKQGPHISVSGRKIKDFDFVYSPEWIHNHKNDINTYAKSLGYQVDVKYFEQDNSTSYDLYPANTVGGLTKHYKLSAKVTLFYNNG